MCTSSFTKTNCEYLEKRICDPRDDLACSSARDSRKPVRLSLPVKLAPPATPLVAPPAPEQGKKKNKEEEKKSSKKGMWAKKLRVLVNKMVGSSHGIIALRVVRSKLRKREETNNNSLGHGPALTPSRTIPAHQLPQLQQLQQLQADSTKVSYCQSATFLDATTVVTTATAVPAVNASATTTPAPSSDSSGTESSADAEEADEPDEVDGKVAPLDLFLWSYPNEQLSPFSGSKDTLVRELPCEVPQDSKGLRKNLRGKWKRLVKKKPEDSCSIPPELRDQLKQIYVY